MPALWTGELIKRIHLAGATNRELARESGMNYEYISQVLHSEHPSDSAKRKLESALERIIQRKVAERAKKDDNEN